jgi:hypothetical protein
MPVLTKVCRWLLCGAGRWLSTSSGAGGWGVPPADHPESRDDLDHRTGQRTHQPGRATDRKADLNPARGQVVLHVRRPAGALNPDSPYHSRQFWQRWTLNVRLHHGDHRTQAPEPETTSRPLRS